MYDPRKWNVPVVSWMNALKYEVMWIAFAKNGNGDATTTEHNLYASSKTDSEVSVGPKRPARLRCDARWLGLAQTADSTDDSVVGITAAGSIYRFNDLHKLSHDKGHPTEHLDEEDKKRRDLLDDDSMEL